MSPVPPHVVAIVPAAGQSSRFGSMKLLADVEGCPLLDRTLASLLDAGLERVVVVVSPTASLDGVRGLIDPRVSVVVNIDPSRGMFSSIQTGLAAVDAGAYVVLPADMPFVKSATISAAFSDFVRTEEAVVAAYAGRRGHPLVLPGSFRAPLLAMDPTSSLKIALVSLGCTPREFAVNDASVLRDVDVPEDLREDDG